MNRRIPRSYGDPVEPACLVPIDRTGQPRVNAMHLFLKTKNELQISAPDKPSQYALVEYDSQSKSWWAQEMVIIRNSLRARPGAHRFELHDQTTGKLNSRPDAIVFFFFESFIRHLPFPTAIPNIIPLRSVHTVPRDLLQEAIDALDEETNCSICAEAFKEPHILGCGHTFCHGCVTEWKKSYLAMRNIRSSRAHGICPICQQPAKVQILNRSLKNVQETLARLKTAFASPAGTSTATSQEEIIEIDSDVEEVENQPLSPESAPDEDDIVCLDDQSQRMQT